MKAKILQEFLNSNLNIISLEKLEEYIDFCIENETTQEKFKTSHHHILPQSKKLPFIEFTNLKYNKWNGAHLLYKDHYKAHSILSEAINHPSIIGAWWGMNFKDEKTKGINGIEIIGSEIHSI